jgi:hypothetical protein
MFHLAPLDVILKLREDLSVVIEQPIGLFQYLSITMLNFVLSFGRKVLLGLFRVFQLNIIIFDEILFIFSRQRCILNDGTESAQPFESLTFEELLVILEHFSLNFLY